jgi:peptidyl-prolyl cis-trans isomerase B (cyclophilin B)
MKMSKYLLILLLPLFIWSCNSDPYTYVIIETEQGEITVKLYNSTPGHRDNFVKLVKEGFYDDLLFHRVMNGFMIQGGDPQSKDAVAGQQLGAGGPGYTVPQEIGAYHFKGALAAARQGDQVNPEKASSGSQFYLVQGVVQSANRLKAIADGKGITYTDEETARYLQEGGTPGLDGDYTVFGEVIEGIEVIDKIAIVPTDRMNRPTTDVLMKIRMK